MKTRNEKEIVSMHFPEIKKKLGFGCMRLPLLADKTVDRAAFSQMVDRFLAAGFNYFDTAHGYLNGESERALRDCLTARHPRERYILTNKLSTYHFEREDEIRPLFESQLKISGVDYFDFYLMHAQDSVLYEKFTRCRAYEIAAELLAEGKIRHLGISFHDRAELLERILTEHPEVEIVQIQFNYVDFEDPVVEARKVYEVCRRFGKPILVMEPVKGGALAKLPPSAAGILDALGGGSPASYAIRFAAGFPGVEVVLSGMGDMAMLEDNVGFMQEPAPLTEREREAIDRVTAILRRGDTIPCTDCRYCMERCPKGIEIPSLFACLNSKRAYNNWNSAYYYKIRTQGGGRASDCIGCGACEAACPQKLPVRDLLKEVAKEFEK